MVAWDWAGRTLPIAWQVRALGRSSNDVEWSLLRAASLLLPPHVRVSLHGERFYAAPALIAWCHGAGWGYRLRCRPRMVVEEKGVRSTLGRRCAGGERYLTDVVLAATRTRTNIVMTPGDDRSEAWIVATSDAAADYPAHDCDPDWSKKAAFSDLETLGFHVEDSRLRRADRVDRLVLVLALAMHWTVLTGMWDHSEDKASAATVSIKRARSGGSGFDASSGTARGC